jgi:NAD(P)H-hydrate epimerase
MPGPDSPPSLTREQVRELDRRAIEEFGIPSSILMENAGRACAEAALELVAGRGGGPVLVLCGPGNNGGDGFVVARTLRNRGLEVELVLAAELERLDRASADVALNARLWKALGGGIGTASTPAEVDRVLPRLMESALVVDALFGTGLVRELASPLTDLVLGLNAAERPVLAVDVPSGLDANTGDVLGAAVRATTTVTFVAPKPGFRRGRGPEHCGRVLTAEIGIPAAWIEEAFFEGRG